MGVAFAKALLRLSVCFKSLSPNEQPKKKSNHVIIAWTPRILAFIAVSV